MFCVLCVLVYPFQQYTSNHPEHEHRSYRLCNCDWKLLMWETDLHPVKVGHSMSHWQRLLEASTWAYLSAIATLRQQSSSSMEDYYNISYASNINFCEDHARLPFSCQSCCHCFGCMYAHFIFRYCDLIVQSEVSFSHRDLQDFIENYMLVLPSGRKQCIVQQQLGIVTKAVQHRTKTHCVGMGSAEVLFTSTSA